MPAETGLPGTGLRIHSTVMAERALRLTLDREPVPEPGDGEVVVRMEAAPIHPADIMVLLAGADPRLARVRRGGSVPETIIPLGAEAAGVAAGRVGTALEAGLEGAGVVIAAGQGAQDWLGRGVALLMPNLGAYGEYCKVKAADCLLLPEAIDARQGAAAFTNPLTALAMVETLHQTGERAMVHTAAASTLGRMLVRICAEDSIGLVNIVRSEQQVEMLRAMGAQHVCNSSSPYYGHQLAAALAATGARVAFDAIGGGTQASVLLAAMEKAAVADMGNHAPYGSAEMKRVYLYGRLDPSDTVIPRGAYGMCWSVEGWAMPPVLDRAGSARKAELMQRIAVNLDSTFATVFGHEITLTQILEPDVMRAYCRHATGGKYLVVMRDGES